MIAEAVIKLLYGNAPLNAIVGKRIRPNVIKPDDVLPAVYVSDYRMEELDCDSSSGVYTGVLEIGVASTDYNECVKVTKVIRDVLRNFSGFVGNIGLTILTGEGTPDDYDEESTTHIKVVEYGAYAQIQA